MTQVYRFHDLIALNLPKGATLYLTPQEAKAFAKALNACAKSVLSESFLDSNYPTVTLELPHEAADSARRYKQKRKV